MSDNLEIIKQFNYASVEIRAMKSMFVNKVNQNAATLIGKLDDPTAVIMGTIDTIVINVRYQKMAEVLISSLDMIQNNYKDVFVDKTQISETYVVYMSNILVSENIFNFSEVTHFQAVVHTLKSKMTKKQIASCNRPDKEFLVHNTAISTESRYTVLKLSMEQLTTLPPNIQALEILSEYEKKQTESKQVNNSMVSNLNFPPAGPVGLYSIPPPPSVLCHSMSTSEVPPPPSVLCHSMSTSEVPPPPPFPFMNTMEGDSHDNN